MKQSKRLSQREIHYLLIQSQHGFNCQSWTRLKPGPRISVLAFHMDMRGQNLWTVCFCSLGTCTQDAGLEVGRAGTPTSTSGQDAGAPSGATAPAVGFCLSNTSRGCFLGTVTCVLWSLGSEPGDFSVCFTWLLPGSDNIMEAKAFFVIRSYMYVTFSLLPISLHHRVMQIRNC